MKQDHHEIHEAEAEDGQLQRKRRDTEDISAHVRFKHAGDDDGHELRHRDAQQQADHQREQADEQRLAQQHPRDLLLAHPQQQIDGKLPLAPADEETAGIDDQKAHDEGDEKAHQIQKGHHLMDDLIRGGPHHSQHGLRIQRIEQVEHHDAQDQRDEIDRIVPDAVREIAQRQLK